MRVLICFLTAVISLVSHAQPDVTFKEWQHQVEQSDFSGIVLAAHNGDEIFRQAFGIANRELNIPFSEHTVFDIGSITKQFTAAAIVKLSEEGKLSLQDSLSNFFDDVPSDKQNITLHNMLTHSAGFPHAFQRFFSLTAASKSVGHSLQHQYDEPGPRWYTEGAGGFLSTASDMKKWYLVLRSKSVLAEKSWSAIFTPHIAVDEAATSYYGYGWVVGVNESGQKSIFHNGSNGYTFADFKYFPDKDVFIFFATNNWDDMPSELLSKLEHVVLDAVANKPIQPTTNVSAD